MNAFLAAPGAIAIDAEHSDAGVAHYGSPFQEQRALRDGEAVAWLADRRVIAVSGEERLSWLDSITSQALARLAPGYGTEFLVLSPQGRVEHAASIVDDGETAWLIADAEDVEPLATWLSRMVFRARARIELRDDLAVIGWEGDASADARARTLAHQPAGVSVVWQDPWTAVSPGGWEYAKVDEHPATERPWREAVVEAAALSRAVGPFAGLMAVDALRVAAWRPRWVAEADERAIPHEVDWIRSAVHLDKGCYRGQETVAKVHNLGHPPRRLVFLHLDGSENVLPERGNVVFAEGKDVGIVTSVAQHYELGPVALAIVGRRVPADATLEIAVGEVRVAAAQETIVPADAGATASVPRLTRLSRRPLAQQQPTEE